MRQYKTLIICLFFLSIFCLSKVKAIVKDYSLLGKSFYIDLGQHCSLLTREKIQTFSNRELFVIFSFCIY